MEASTRSVDTQDSASASSGAILPMPFRALKDPAILPHLAFLNIVEKPTVGINTRIVTFLELTHFF
jgi:uncharacterized protein YceK